VNTPLGIAVMATSLIQDKTDVIAADLKNKTLQQKQLISYIEIVQETTQVSNKGLDRVIELMQNFKQVAADQIVEKTREINISSYITEVMTTLTNELKRYNARYQFIETDIELIITTIPGALAQVLTNLVNNSLRHGFEEQASGLITIEVEHFTLDEVTIIYKDDGIGMSAEVLNKVFEPFFTTKRNKGGTGLGLNIVYNIVEQKLEGHIVMTSIPGKGICCTITLPVMLADNAVSNSNAPLHLS